MSHRKTITTAIAVVKFSLPSQPCTGVSFPVVFLHQEQCNCFVLYHGTPRSLNLFHSSILCLLSFYNVSPLCCTPLLWSLSVQATCANGIFVLHVLLNFKVGIPKVQQQHFPPCQTAMQYYNSKQTKGNK